jgi:uncharacterized membrane protein YcaP (DUF421 family)
MPFFQNGYVQIALSTVAVYLFIVVAIRLFGKTEISQLSVTDLVFIMLISNAVQNAMVGSNSTLSGGLVAAGALFLINFIFKECLYYIPWFGHFVQGESLMLIYKGRINQANLRKAKLTVDELMEAVREHGVSKASEVDLAVLEVDGNISVLSEDFSRRTTKTVRKSRPPRKQTKKQQ